MLFLRGDVLWVLLTVLCTILVVSLFYHYKNRWDMTNYDLERNEARLSDLRKSLERQIYEMNDNLLKSEKRWKEINHLLISYGKRVQRRPDARQRAGRTDLLKVFGLKSKDVKQEGDLVFVLTPFHPRYNEVMLCVYKTCQEIGLRCYRGDEEQVTGDLMRHILSYIVRARIVVANIEGRNANVYYELGLAHALNKPTILICRQETEVPFDIKSNKIIIYKNYKELEELLKRELSRALVKTPAK